MIVTAVDAKRVTAHQDRKPQGIAGVGLTPEQVNGAIDRGAAYLWNDLRTSNLANGVVQLGSDDRNKLICLALVHAKAHKKFPEFDAALRDYISRWDVTQYDGHATYNYGILCMLIEAYGDPKFLPKLRDAARYLVESQGPKGSWTYNADIPKEIFGIKNEKAVLTVSGGTPLDGQSDPAAAWKRITNSKPAYDGDASNTQYAMLGLMSAARCGVKLPADTWKRALAVNQERFNTDEGGWGYEGGSAYGSMTAAGICASTIARYELGEADPDKDDQVEYGLGWMSRNFSVSENPKGATWTYYYLYSMERVGRILDTEFIDDKEWYPLGAQFLVGSQQANGSWKEKGPEEDPRLATSFALLFLTRATQTLKVDEKRGGDGTLATDYIAPANRIYIILDCSGSMMDEMDGKQKFDIAKGAVSDLIDALPKNTELALRVYGSTKRALDEGCDEDTQLLVPMASLDRDQIKATLKPLRARGKTPLALSLLDAKQDLSGAGTDQPIALLLLTDGGEDTMPRKDPVKAADELASISNLQFNIVGFDIGQEDWNTQLRAMATHGHGKYWPAAKGAELGRQLRISMLGAPERFSVLDKSGKEVAHGAFGETIKLPEGKYTFRTNYSGQQFSETFWINTDKATSVTFNASKVAAGNPSLPQTVEDAKPALIPIPPPAPTHTPKFCTHCGAPLPAGAKFCPKCGEKVE